MKMIKMKNKLLLFALLGLVITFSSCEDEDEDPVIPNEEEVITTLRYILVPTSGGDTVTFVFQDLDGDGGNAPVITNDTLVANTTYTASIELLNEQENPAEDITQEVSDEDDEHQLFFQSDIATLTVDYNDQDGNGNPLGLATNVSTGDATSGTLTITLRHEPNKTAAGVSDGDITNAGGETDIEVTFDVEIE